MRFKGTLVLLLLCVGLGAFLYFYEIKGGEQRDKAKQEEKVIWKVPGDDVQQLDLTIRASISLQSARATSNGKSPPRGPWTRMPTS